MFQPNDCTPTAQCHAGGASNFTICTRDSLFKDDGFQFYYTFECNDVASNDLIIAVRAHVDLKLHVKGVARLRYPEHLRARHVHYGAGNVARVKRLDG